MYIKVKTVDGQRNTLLNVSKLTKIKQLKKEIKQEFDVDENQQRLFFRGKQLEDDCTLFDYSVNINDVIQVMIKLQVDESATDNGSIKNGEKDGKGDVAEEEVEAESLWFRVGDAIDCLDNGFGAWFEAVIVKIFTKSGKLSYRVRWDIPDCAEDDIFVVEENFVRPRAWNKLKISELKPGQKVMINHNLEDADSVGQWYDFSISEVKGRQLVGTLHIGTDSRVVKDLKVNLKEDVFAIEKPELLTERDDEKYVRRIPKQKRKVPVKCTNCNDNPRRKCKECSCRQCGGKHDPHLILMCDECDYGFHLSCLNPPLTKLPEEDDWYCSDCKVNENEIIKAGEKFVRKKSAQAEKVKAKPRDWGSGMACVGRTTKCTIVPQNHRGPIPGIEVGTLWLYRIQASEAGVHRPHVAGIHGRASDCAYSLVLSGGYEDDVDNGDEFMYTGSGGRDLTGNKRTAKQSRDQELTLMNKALAINCNAALNDKNGATAKDWKAGIPIRVIRNYKLSNHSEYAPKEGNRYDGIYKVVKYWPVKGQSGFRVWRYLLRRDDPAPAPWTPEGKKRIKKLGLTMQYPENYHEAQEKKLAGNNKRKSTVEEASSPKENKEPNAKRQKTLVTVAFKIDNSTLKLIKEDEANVKLWNECTKMISDGKASFLNKVENEFACVVCQDLVNEPITTPCAHNICRSCLKRSFAVETYACPMCRHSLDKTFPMTINTALSSILLELFPGYNNGR